MSDKNNGGCGAYIGLYIVFALFGAFMSCDAGDITVFLFGTFVAPAIMAAILLPLFRKLL